jgi:hypothetical protein
MSEKLHGRPDAEAREGKEEKERAVGEYLKNTLLARVQIERGNINHCFPSLSEEEQNDILRKLEENVLHAFESGQSEEAEGVLFLHHPKPAYGEEDVGSFIKERSTFVLRDTKELGGALLGGETIQIGVDYSEYEKRENEWVDAWVGGGDYYTIYVEPAIKGGKVIAKGVKNIVQSGSNSTPWAEVDYDAWFESVPRERHEFILKLAGVAERQALPTEVRHKIIEISDTEKDDVSLGIKPSYERKARPRDIVFSGSGENFRTPRLKSIDRDGNIVSE